MIRKLIFSALFGLAVGFMPAAAVAQKAVLAPEVESLVKAQSSDSVKTSLRQEAGPRRPAPAPTAKAAPEAANERADDLRMLVVALLLMVAIALRRYRSDAR